MARLYRFGEEEYKPDTQCYYVLIKAIGQIPSIKNGPVQAEELLYEMMEAFQDGNDALRPNGATFVNVYHSFRTSNAFVRIMQLPHRCYCTLRRFQKGSEGQMNP
jgi:hypothetical protein